MRLDYDGLLAARLPELAQQLSRAANDPRVPSMDRTLARTQAAVATRLEREHRERQAETCAEQPRRYMRCHTQGGESEPSQAERVATVAALMWCRDWSAWAQRVTPAAK